MYPKFQSALSVRVNDYGAWPPDVLERHPRVVGFLIEQGLDSHQIDQILVSTISGNWNLTSAYICGTGAPPPDEDRPYFFADFLGEKHSSWLQREAYLTFGKLLLALKLI